MAAGDRIVAAARALVGTPFRLHGRSPATGVDCVGLALLSARAAGLNVEEPPPYRLHAGATPPVEIWMHAAGFVAPRLACAGDIVLVRISPLQPHLVIDAGGGVIHAHAGLGRVVIMPMPAEWRELSRWRYDGVNS
jgi:lipoprotein Spr